MFEQIRRRGRSAALLGTAAALAGGGMALAADDNGSGSSGGDPARELPAPPPLPPPDHDLTYAEIHVQRNGEAEVIRTDAGEVVATTGDSITVAENDGNEVTIPVDDETRFATGPGEEGDVDDLEQGDHVLVTGPKGEAADVVFVLPDRAELRRAFKGHKADGDLIPAPPGPRGMGFATPLPPPQGGR